MTFSCLMADVKSAAKFSALMTHPVTSKFLFGSQEVGKAVADSFNISQESTAEFNKLREMFIHALDAMIDDHSLELMTNEDSAAGMNLSFFDLLEAGQLLRECDRGDAKLWNLACSSWDAVVHKK